MDANIYCEINGILIHCKECAEYCKNCEYRYYWNDIALCKIKTLQYKLADCIDNWEKHNRISNI